MISLMECSVTGIRLAFPVDVLGNRDSAASTRMTPSALWWWSKTAWLQKKSRQRVVHFAV